MEEGFEGAVFVAAGGGFIAHVLGEDVGGFGVGGKVAGEVAANGEVVARVGFEGGGGDPKAGFKAVADGDAPAGLNDLVDKTLFDGVLGQVAVEEGAPEFAEAAAVAADEGGGGSEDAVGAGVAGGGGFAFWGAGAGGLGGVGAVGGELSMSGHG